MGWMVGVQFQAGENIFLFSIIYRPALGPNQPPIQWAQGALSPEVSRVGHEADHSRSSSAKVKNNGLIPPVPDVSTTRYLNN
jgi:hypothetical protein